MGATLASSIRLTDGMTPVLKSITSALDITIHSFAELQNQTNNPIDTASIQAASEQLKIAGAEISRIEDDIARSKQQQDGLNNSVKQGSGFARDLKSQFMGILSITALIAGAKKAVELSDSVTQTNARLSMTVDDGGSVKELQDKIFASAQRSRADYLTVSDTVAKLGLRAGDIFKNNDETVQFAENLNKEFAISGASQEEMASASLQLTQALGSGVLRGEEFNAVFEAAPNIMQTVADYMNVPRGQLKNMSAEGQITSDIVKNAMLSATDSINQQFKQMPLTFSQVWTGFKNIALKAFDPIMLKLSEIANSEKFQAFSQSAGQALGTVGNIVSGVLDMISSIGGFIYDNWSMIGPVVWGILTPMLLYQGAIMAISIWEGVVAGTKLVLALASYAHAAATGTEASAAAAATAAQWGLNTALLACPITWIIVAIIALIAIIYAVVALINKLAGTSISATGVIAGAFSTVGAVIGNIFLAILQSGFAVVESLQNGWAAFANFFGNILNDPVSSIIYLVRDMADIVLNIIEHLAGAIDTVFGSNLAGAVSGWRDGLSSTADSLAQKYGNGSYVEVAQKLDINEELSKIGINLDTFRFNYTDSYNAGYNWGSNLESEMSNMFSGFEIPNPDDYNNSLGDYSNSAMGSNDNLDDISNYGKETAENTDKTANSLSSIADNMDIIKSLAERAVLNQYTSTNVKVEMNNVNHISSDVDLDGFENRLLNSVKEYAAIGAEGVHN